MALFGNIFKETKTTSNFNWIILNNEIQLDEILKNSKDKTVVIFKHSTRCGVSRGVLKQFESENNSKTKNMDFYYLDLLNFREISNAIAVKFNIEHQSPQLIVLKNGKVIANASHYDILSIQLN